MITFLIFTLAFVLANAAFATLIWVSIQPEQWIDRLFGWQKMLNKIGMKPGFGNEFLYKALGGCEFCFCHFITVICFVFYCLFMSNVIGWFDVKSTWVQIVLNIVWYLLYNSMGTIFSFLFITKLLRHEKI